MDDASTSESEFLEIADTIKAPLNTMLQTKAHACTELPTFTPEKIRKAIVF